MPPSPASGPSDGDAGLNRDRFYSEPEEDADFEYEVEPLDADVVAAERERARAKVVDAESAIDVDAIYRELDRRDDFDAMFESVKARFSLKSLLIAVTVVALLLGIGGSGLLTGRFFALFIVLSLIGLTAAHMWLNYRDAQRRDELIAKREAELRRARRASGDPSDMYDDPDEPAPPRDAPGVTDALSTVKAVLRFGLADWLVAVPIAAVLLALSMLAGSAAAAAAGLGLVAVMGFGLQAAEINVPRRLILAWWVALLGFGATLLLSIVLTVIGVDTGISLFGGGGGE